MQFGRPLGGSISDRLQHARKIGPNVSIREAEHLVTEAAEVMIAVSIESGIVRFTIDFYDQGAIAAYEIADVAFDHDLAAEFQAGELRAPDRLPQSIFLWRGFASHCARVAS